MEAGGGGRVVGEYEIGKQIGSGAFSVVWLGRRRGGGGGREVAVKEIMLDRLNKKLRDSLLSEVYILRRISHPNIIALFDFIQVGGRHPFCSVLFYSILFSVPFTFSHTPPFAGSWKDIPYTRILPRR
jgi:serine/threonine protein kinase